jgi:hypothetical protein
MDRLGVFDPRRFYPGRGLDTGGVRRLIDRANVFGTLRAVRRANDALVAEDSALDAMSQGRAQQSVDEGPVTRPEADRQVAHVPIFFHSLLEPSDIAGLDIQPPSGKAEKLRTCVAEQRQRRVVHVDDGTVATREVNRIR